MVRKAEIKNIGEERESTAAGTVIALCLVVTEEAVREAKEDRTSHEVRCADEDRILTMNGVTSLQR